MAQGAGEAGAPPYVPVDGTPWRLSMGLRRLDPRRWLEVDEHRDEELAAKRRLLATRRDVVFVALPGSEPACEELRELVAAFLATGHPGLAERNPEAGDPARHPLEAAARSVQEDLCVLEHHDGRWRLTAACVCFPSRWSLTEKLGRALGEIHAPVPGFDAALAAPAETFFDRLAVERPVWRCNWTLLETPELHLPAPADRRRPHEATDPAHVFFRVERQTLRRLERTGAVVFTIRTYVTALDRLLTAEPDLAGRLAATLRTVPDDVAAYKGWTGWLASLVAMLDRAPRE